MNNNITNMSEKQREGCVSNLCTSNTVVKIKIKSAKNDIYSEIF